MRFKLLNTFWLSLGLAFLSGSAMAAGVAPFAPYSIVDFGGENTVYYASTLTSDAKYYLDTANGFAEYDFTSQTAPFYFTVSGLDSTNRYVYVFAEGTSTDTFFSVPLGICASPPCTAATANYRVDGAGATQVTVAIVPRGICDSNLGGSTNAKGCSGGAVVENVNPIPGFRLRFIVSSQTMNTAVTLADKKAGAFLQVFPQNAGPRITTCPTGYGFFPGDGVIVVDSGAFAVVADSTDGGSSNTFPYLFVSAQKSGPVPADRRTATLFTRIARASGSVEAGPFVNSTSTTQTFYQVDYAIEDSAGIYAFCGDPPASSVQLPGGTTAYPLTNVFSTDIQGFLRESNCFVATASYRDGRAPGVMLLRNFRDEFLSSFELGRDFIGWYYANGPKAADWLIEHPIFRSISLTALMPLQALAWVALHPAVLLVPIFALILLLGFFAETGLLLSVLLVGSLGLATIASASEQPYIDSLISELPKDPNPPTNGTPDPYLQSLKQKLGKEDTSEGYTAEVKRQLEPRDGSEGYTSRIQPTLPKASGSAIEDYRNGKKLKANKGALDTRSAFGFTLNASATRTYTAGDRQDVAYDTVYGNKWVPDFTVHYEWRPFTGDFIKKFGLYSSIGSSFTKAKGIFDYSGPFGAESHTDFQFVVIPVNVGLIYRFSLFGFMWPYFGAGPSVIGFLESRGDTKKNQKGYDFGYWALGGVAFGLDWMSPKSSWDQYESTGVKHSYFTLDYSYLQSVAGGLVEFTVDGVQLGFTFEI